MKKRFLAAFLSILLCLSAAACAPKNKEIDVPENSVIFTIGEGNGKRLKGFGAECDPLFLSENVGETGETDGVSWECRAEDWENVIAPRMEEMGLQRIRVMLCPGYFCPTYENYAQKNYTWSSVQMSSLYQVLETAHRLDISVNLTYWGVDVFDCGWLAKSQEGWMSFPKAEYEDAFCQLFADAVLYLKENRRYSCIDEVTIFNEPNFYGFENYARICRAMHEKFEQAGIRGGVAFNLSDSAESKDWLERCANELSDVSDFLNAHTYALGYEQSDKEIQDICLDWVARMGNSGQELYFNEFGTNKATSSHTASDNHSPARGVEVVRIAANMVNAGIVGASYWVLFSQLYNREETGRYMDMGLWGCANEGYACRPVYYAYTLLTRFAPAGAYVYPVRSAEDNLVCFAVKTPSGKWSYIAVNHGDDSRKLAFFNKNEIAGAQMKRYVYDAAHVPTDDRPITADASLKLQGNYLFDELAGQSVAVYTQL